MTLVAKYIGKYEYQGGLQEYRVNVRKAQPTGNIGDAGIVRSFKTEAEAKAYANHVNTTGIDIFQKSNTTPQKAVIHQGDVFEKSLNKK